MMKEKLIHFANILGAPACENYETQITCEDDVAHITCPDSMSIFIIDAFYGRKDRDA